MSKYYKIVLSLLFYIICVLAYNFYSYKNYITKETAVLDERLKVAAYAVYNLLGEEFFYKAVEKDAVTLEEDWENINKLTAYNNHANLSFIYSSIKKENKIYLTSSSASKEELEAKTEVHYFYHFDSAGKALVNAFESKKIIYENHTDEWGDFRAVHIPITLDNKETIVVSADVSIEYLSNKLDEIKYKYFLEAVFYLLITIPVIIAVTFFIRKKVLDSNKIETKYKKLYDTMRDGFGAIDLDSNIINVNRSFCKMLGYSEEELLKMKFSDITPKKWLDYELELIEQIPKSKTESELYEKEYVCKDGTLLPVELHVSVTKNELNEITGYWAIVRDIRDRKKVQQELLEKEELMMSQSRSAAMGDMISMIAHQWKQPLASLSMVANSMKADYELGSFETKYVESYYSDIDRQVQHLSKTIDDFRDFFKPNKTKQLTSIQTVIDDTLKIIEKSLENNNIELIKDFKEVGEISIFPNELFHILINIINNAKEALVHNRVNDRKIYISSYKQNENICIEIEDNAGGVAKEIIGKIFEPYFTTKEKLNGTGIGLYMAKTIIEKHFMGKIQIENTDQGAKFILIIPV